MTPKQVLQKWIKAFNCQDAKLLGELYSDDAINHQVADKPLIGKTAIRNSFEYFFKAFPDVGFKTVNIFEDGEWAILEWDGWGTQNGEFVGMPATNKSYKLQGCGFFQIKNDKIVFQRGYWDKLTWYKQIGISNF